jgi:hypothetical protein
MGSTSMIDDFALRIELSASASFKLGASNRNVLSSELCRVELKELTHRANGSSD